MIEGYSSLTQTLLGTLFTWGLTALGAAVVFIFQSGQRRILDGSLGFAAGVMTAASYWSLLAPAIELAEQSGYYGESGQWAFIPASVGFMFGAAFVYAADILMPHIGVNPTRMALELETDHVKKDGYIPIVTDVNNISQNNYPPANSYAHLQTSDTQTTQRRKVTSQTYTIDEDLSQESSFNSQQPSFNAHQSSFNSEMINNRQSVNWRRILLLIIAITIHNIPEGLAVGVGFGAIGKTPAATFENARNLAIGIGIQNFPEGLAVSLPLRGAGMSTLKSFWYGQLSGMVEPIAGIFGAIAVVIAEPILPYALSFAAGAMIYVVVDDIIPEAQVCGNGKLASWGAVIGFVTMMSLDVGLG